MDNKYDNQLTEDLRNAVKTIKTAILQSQARAAKMISGSQLSLYFGVGLYVSANSREGTWGTGAMKAIRMFKDEYLLDYINVEDIDAEDDDRDE